MIHFTTCTSVNRLLLVAAGCGPWSLAAAGPACRPRVVASRAVSQLLLHAFLPRFWFRLPLARVAIAAIALIATIATN
jgi:hypothetical protein